MIKYFCERSIICIKTRPVSHHCIQCFIAVDFVRWWCADCTTTEFSLPHDNRVRSLSRQPSSLYYDNQVLSITTTELFMSFITTTEFSIAYVGHINWYIRITYVRYSSLACFVRKSNSKHRLQEKTKMVRRGGRSSYGRINDYEMINMIHAIIQSKKLSKFNWHIFHWTFLTNSFFVWKLRPGTDWHVGDSWHTSRDFG